MPRQLPSHKKQKTWWWLLTAVNVTADAIVTAILIPKGMGVLDSQKAKSSQTIFFSCTAHVPTQKHGRTWWCLPDSTESGGPVVRCRFWCPLLCGPPTCTLRVLLSTLRPDHAGASRSLEGLSYDTSTNDDVDVGERDEKGMGEG